MDEGGPLICLTGGAHNDAAGVLKLLEHAACGAGTESDFLGKVLDGKGLILTFYLKSRGCRIR